ncbi:MAG: type II toxin-antitoxin system Phd/YefM family antitoxin [Chloroflexota bacterium]|nr:type II toxin-antitoxin system Phd/YefM family antitoxin [Chloroflexota bacterium]
MPVTKSISSFKAEASEVIGKIADAPVPILITQNGEAKAVLQDIESYERQVETLALLKILALGEKQVREGRTKSASEVFERLRQRYQST